MYMVMCSHFIVLWTTVIYFLGWVVFILSAIQCDYDPVDRVSYNQLHAVTVHTHEMSILSNPVKYAALDSVIGSEKNGNYLVRVDDEINAGPGGVCTENNPKCAMSGAVEKLDHFSLIENMKSSASLSSTHNPSLLVAIIGIILTWLSAYTLRREMNAMMHRHQKLSSYDNETINHVESFLLYHPAVVVFMYISLVVQSVTLFALCFVKNNRTDSNSTFVYGFSLLFWTVYLQPLEYFQTKVILAASSMSASVYSMPEAMEHTEEHIEHETKWNVAGFHAPKIKILAPKFGAYMVNHVDETKSKNLSETSFSDICLDVKSQLAVSYVQVLLLPATFVSLLMVDQRFDIDTQFQKLLVLTTLYCVLDIIWDRVELVSHYVHTLLTHDKKKWNPLSINTLPLLFVHALVLYAVFVIIYLSATAGKAVPSAYYMYRFWLLYVYMVVSTLYVLARALSYPVLYMQPCDVYRMRYSNVLTCALLTIVATCVMHGATESIV